MIRLLLLIANLISIYTTLFYLIYMLSYREKKKLKSLYLPITVIIPSYNKEDTIKECIYSVLNQNYPRNLINILVVDDRSKDKTVEIVKEITKKEKNVKLIVKKEHSGKVKSLNIALKRIDTPLFMVLDADTFLDKNALKNAIKHFGNREVGAVITSMKVHKPKSFFERLQDIEYSISIFIRRVLSLNDSLNTTHGATIFRSNIIKELGGFDENNLTEDLEIALRLIKNGYKVISELSSISYTIVPKSIKGYWKQRLRWYVGYLRNTYKYRSIFLRRENLKLTFFTVINTSFWIFVLTFLFLLIFKDLYSNLVRDYIIIKETSFYYWFKVNFLSNSVYFTFYQIFTFSTLIIFLVSFLYVLKFTRDSFKSKVLNVIAYLLFSSVIQGALWLNCLVLSPIYGRKGWKH